MQGGEEGGEEGKGGWKWERAGGGGGGVLGGFGRFWEVLGNGCKSKHEPTCSGALWGCGRLHHCVRRDLRIPEGQMFHLAPANVKNQWVQVMHTFDCSMATC